MKILFFATSEFALPALKKIFESGRYDIVAVVTQPDKPAGRKQLPLPSPVKKAAQEMGLKIIQPVKLTPSFLSPFLSGGGETSPSPFSPMRRGRLRGGRFNLFVVASYGKIIPKEILEIPKYGALNIHPSLLPKYRGPSPIQAVILNGDQETGITIIEMDEEVDHGPIVAQKRITNYESRITYSELHNTLAKLSAELLIKILPDYVAGEIKPIPQDHSQATFTKIITKADARIDWNFAAAKIEAMVRAYESWPVAWTTLEGKRLKIYTSIPSPDEGRVREGLPGEVEIKDNRISVQTGSGLLELLDLQIEGSRRVKAKDFLNGYPGLNGKILV